MCFCCFGHTLFCGGYVAHVNFAAFVVLLQCFSFNLGEKIFYCKCWFLDDVFQDCALLDSRRVEANRGCPPRYTTQRKVISDNVLRVWSINTLSSSLVGLFWHWTLGGEKSEQLIYARCRRFDYQTAQNSRCWEVSQTRFGEYTLKMKCS